MRCWIRTVALATALALLLGILPTTAAAPGDLNADGTADYRDAAYLLYHTLLPEEYPLAEAPDYTGEGTTDERDALYLLYHALLPEEYPLLGRVALPEIGYDPDGKGRIALTAIARTADTVSVTFTNRSSTWVTEETSQLTYTCTAADGTPLATGTYYLGYIKCGSSVTGELRLPAGTAELAFTGGSIEYWGVWK